MRNRSSLLRLRFALFALCLALVSCKKDPIEPTPTLPQPMATSHVVVAYLVAENSLSSALQTDFDEMREGRDSIPQDAQMIIYIDDVREPRLYRLTTESDTVRLHSWNPDICSTDSLSFCSVLDKVKEFTPSCERYDLVMGSHATGWIPQTNLYSRTFGVDNNRNVSSSNVGPEMNISTLRDVLAAKLGHVGYIFFDACLMQGIEVPHLLRDVTDFVVTSPTEIPGKGANYTHIMPILFAKDEAPARIVQQYYDDEMNGGTGVVISAIKTSETPALAETVKPIVKALMDNRTTPSLDGVQTYREYETPFYSPCKQPTCYDMLGIAMLADTVEGYQAFRQQLERTVIAYRATNKWYARLNTNNYITDITRTCGVSMFVPEARYDKDGWNDYYHAMPWYTAAGYDQTGW